MFKKFAILSLAVLTLGLGLSTAYVSAADAAQIGVVKGYYKSNGTYVMPHLRSYPNGTTYDNLSNWR